MKVLLFSGGVESACLAAMEKPDLALTIDYGQVCAAGEIAAAVHIASLLVIPHEVVVVPMGHLGAGDLTGIPDKENTSGVPEHWPFRNQMLITIAAMALADQHLEALTIGTVATDTVHSDGNADFLVAMDQVLRTQAPQLSLNAPALEMTTAELVVASGIDINLLRWTFSCHRAPIACGNCRGCYKSIELFADLGL